MKRLLTAVVCAFLLGAAPIQQYRIDLTHYFNSPAAEALSRARLLRQAAAFVDSATPQTAPAMLAWLQSYDALLEGVERHDIYVYLRSEENQEDVADAKADDALGALEGRVTDRLLRAARQLGPAHVEYLLRAPALAPYRYLLHDSLARGAHQLNPDEQRAIDTAVTPVLDAATTSYKALRKSPDKIAGHQDAYAALLVSIVAAHDGIARLRGFTGAPEASYFDKSIPAGSVERTLRAVEASGAYARYRSVAALAPKPAFTPAALAIGDAIPVILAAEAPMGHEYASAYAALLNGENHRLDICTEERCDDDGFSVGFAGTESAAYFGDYGGSVADARAVAHESGHAVHRQFMNSNQPIAAYNQGPHFMFESFAIFNELLFLNHLYETAPNDAQRAYYLNFFCKDATFQVFGSAEETALESAVYRGVDDRTIRTTADLDALTTKVFARYDPSSAQDPDTALYWARNRLFYTDPLYDVNYLYAGLLALRYFTDFQRDPPTFSKRYVALLKNGFDDSPATLEHEFLGIDLLDEPGLVSNAAAVVDGRTAVLAKLYAGAATPAEVRSKPASTSQPAEPLRRIR